LNRTSLRLGLLLVVVLLVLLPTLFSSQPPSIVIPTVSRQESPVVTPTWTPRPTRTATPLPTPTATPGLAAGCCLYAPAWSPDGQKLAFVREQDEDADIWTIDADGSGLTNLTTGSLANEQAPVWSPDGRSIAFNSDQDGNVDLWIMNADGTHPRNLTPDSPEFDGYAAWSPDGEQLVYNSGTGLVDVWIVAADGSERFSLTGDLAGSFTTNSWGPDKQTIMYFSFTGPGGLWQRSLDLQEPRHLIDYDGLTGYALAPDGNTIAFEPDFLGAVMLVDLAAAELRGIPTQPETMMESLAWMPEGDRIVFCLLDAQPQSNIWTMWVEDGRLENLTPDRAYDRWPAISPDGTRIAFVSDAGGVWNLWLMAPDGSGRVNLTRGVLAVPGS
jgi:Tol biopolymer transport system component